MCEDRGIEDYGQLRDLAGEDGIYKHLKDLFVKADKRFNSGLFHFAVEEGRDEPPDTITTKLKIDDKLLKDIIKRLYYPPKPLWYSPRFLPRFSARFTSSFWAKSSRLTGGHVAKVEDKPEVKKAGGVYYTPSLHRRLHRQAHRRQVARRPGPQEGVEAAHPRPCVWFRLVRPRCLRISALLAPRLVRRKTNQPNTPKPSMVAR